MGRGKLSLKATIRLTLLLVAASVILTAAALFGAIRHRDRNVIATQQALVIAELAAADLQSQLHRQPGLGAEAWLDRAAAWPAVEGVALLQDNGLLAAAAAEPPPPDVVRLAQQYAASTMIWLPQRSVEGDPLALQIQPLPARGLNMKLVLVLAIRPDRAAGLASWGFFLPLGIIGLLGVCIGILWLSHEVVRPIEMLSTLGSDESKALTLTEPTGASRYAELARLAQTMRCLHVNLDQWRHKVDQLERSFDQRVEQETRKMQRTLQRTQREMWRDPLTGLYNRRMLTENGQRLLVEQREARSDMSVMMFDVDHFKTLNDTLGHMAGDEMLQFVAQLIKQAVRREDFAIRYGGDEFLVLLPGVPVGDAEQIAARVVALFRQHAKLLRDLDPKPSLSAGVASLAITHAQSMEELMHLADTALYQAKRGGKNRVGLYDPRGIRESGQPAPDQAPARSVVAAGKRVLHAIF